MRKITLLIIPLCFLFSKITLAQKLAFSYDASGNQTERRWICINCTTASRMAEAKSKALGSELKSAELTTERGLKVAPNPLREVLNVYWGVPEKVYLKSIDVYSIGGNKVFSAKYNADTRQTQISFQHLPPGTYVLIGRYSDAITETVKLIKI